MVGRHGLCGLSAAVVELEVALEPVSFALEQALVQKIALDQRQEVSLYYYYSYLNYRNAVQ